MIAAAIIAKTALERFGAFRMIAESLFIVLLLFLIILAGKIKLIIHL
jgi:hypothetical protein